MPQHEVCDRHQTALCLDTIRGPICHRCDDEVRERCRQTGPSLIRWAVTALFEFFGVIRGGSF